MGGGGDTLASITIVRGFGELSWFLGDVVTVIEGERGRPRRTLYGGDICWPSPRTIC